MCRANHFLALLSDAMTLQVCCCGAGSQGSALWIAVPAILEPAADHSLGGEERGNQDRGTCHVGPQMALPAAIR
eukprot:scaffold2012_cov228-Pinguiococcus_pyrenoidosus.AAC.10